MKSIHQPEYKHLLLALIKARKDAGITQQELAETLGKPQSYVSKFETGERRLDIIEFLAVTDAIGVDYKKVIGR